jgi:hypothetical protein
MRWADPHGKPRRGGTAKPRAPALGRNPPSLEPYRGETALSPEGERFQPLHLQNLNVKSAGQSIPINLFNTL